MPHAGRLTVMIMQNTLRRVLYASLCTILCVVSVSVLPGAAAAQIVFDGGLHAVPLVTHVSPMLQGDAFTEAYLTQPTLLGTATFFGGVLHARAALSLEGLTLERGELGPGAHGEGYVDRRHPHTYLHELMVSVVGDVGAATYSFSAGRGFAPFGTDDPMMRPFVKFPVNHHLSQVLERLAAIGAVRAGPVMVEGGVFTGVEPMSPSDAGDVDRFADSWAARVTLMPATGVEVQASHAWVVSPEMPRGAGDDQRKWSASARYERPHAFGAVYAMAEWSRSTHVADGDDVYANNGVLVEASLDRDGWRPALRFERTDRAEDGRSFDPFRTPWPHADPHLLGITRWTTTSARVERAVAWRGLRAAPFVEAALAHVGTVGVSIFDPEAFYGDTRIWSLNAGVRLGAGWHAHRMGRYAPAGPAGPGTRFPHVHDAP